MLALMIFSRGILARTAAMLGASAELRGRVPGADGDAVLGERLVIGADDVARLRAAGVFGAAQPPRA